MVDDNIVITVVEIRGDKVRLGIEAPREVPIHRSEVRDAIAIQDAIAVQADAAAKLNPPVQESAPAE